MLVSAFITHKKAEHFTDCQDRFSINVDTKSIALSDGMSQSIFQKYWAEILVEKFTSTPDWVPNLASVKELAPIWKDKVLGIIQRQKDEGSRSAWRAERNLIDGLSAGATFLGIRFKGNEFECDVLGDSCLILIHDNKIIDIISSEDVSVFDSYPDYFDSNPNKDGKGSPRNHHGTFNSGDTILLVSDPFSDFLLKNRNTSKEAIYVDRLLGINSHSEFEEVVEHWRNLGMHNDDSTLIIIKHGDGDSFNITFKDSIDNLIEQERIGSKNQQKELIKGAETAINEEEKSSSKEELNAEDVPNEQKKAEFKSYFDENFFKKLESILYKCLGGWTLNKRKKKQKVSTIIKEIKSLISQTTQN